MRTFLFALLLLSMGSTSVGAQADFYKGKTIKLVIGYSAGGKRSLGAGDRAVLGQVYSRESEFRRAKYARRGHHDRG